MIWLLNQIKLKTHTQKKKENKIVEKQNPPYSLFPAHMIHLMLVWLIPLCLNTFTGMCNPTATHINYQQSTKKHQNYGFH